MTAVVVRQATVDDVEELTRLRAVMLAAVDGRPVPLDAEWAERCRADLTELLAEGTHLVAMVVDAPEGGGLASVGVGVVDVRLPAPGRVNGRVGHISSMCTDERWRRRGYAQAVLEALLDWLHARGCARVELSASDEGEPLYRRSGFEPPPNPSLRRQLG